MKNTHSQAKLVHTGKIKFISEDKLFWNFEIISFLPEGVNRNFYIWKDSQENMSNQQYMEWIAEIALQKFYDKVKVENYIG